MERRKEETLAAVLWAFIQRLRETQGPLAAGLDGLTPADAAELAALFRTAEDLHLALEISDEIPAPRAADRVRAAIAQRHQAQSKRLSRRPVLRWRSQFPAARYRWAMAVAAALIAGVVAGSRLPASDLIAHPPAAVTALTHDQTRARVPRLMAGKLSAPESRAVFWHLAHCKECFALYQRMAGEKQSQSMPRRTSLVARLPTVLAWRADRR